ncbi:MAG: AAA family ATPase [Verrucomicrobiaceae bacterium]|nr:AAA family ATPase [Verrucomicrobiaceae bacterium]
MTEASGLYDPLADEDKPRPKGQTGAPIPEKKRFVQWHKPSELAAYKVPEDVPLVGDLHIFKGGIFVLGGAPGVGKSFCLSQLALSGATGADWFGMRVHRKFKTMILQAENGLVRLSSEYAVHCETPGLDDWVRVSADVDTFSFEDPAFCAEFRADILDFKPDVIVLDPWNRATRDSMEKDFRTAFDNIKSCLPEGPEKPALGIVAHTRKPRMGESVKGRGLLNLLSGSLILGSVPRSAFILQAATDDPEGNEFVFSCCKNNNGPLGHQTAWRREGVRFVGPLADFDWDSFNSAGKSGEGKNEKIEEKHVRHIFEDGKKWMKPAEAVAALRKLTGAGRSAAYNALDKGKGRFWDILRVNPADGTITVDGGDAR